MNQRTSTVYLTNRNENINLNVCMCFTHVVIFEIMFPPAGLHTIAGHFRIWVVKHSSQTNRPFAQQRSAAGCWTVSLLTATMDMQLHADFHNSGMRSSKAIDEHLNPRQSLSLLTSCTTTFTIRECGMTSLAYDRSKASILLASHLWIPWRLAKRTEGSSFSFLWCLLLLLLSSLLQQVTGAAKPGPWCHRNV